MGCVIYGFAVLNPTPPVLTIWLNVCFCSNFCSKNVCHFWVLSAMLAPIHYSDVHRKCLCCTWRAARSCCCPRLTARRAALMSSSMFLPRWANLLLLLLLPLCAVLVAMRVLHDMMACWLSVVAHPLPGAHYCRIFNFMPSLCPTPLAQEGYQQSCG